ncbi:2-phospho-L-lactate guanylyltransferase [Natronorubrum sulfidifaciens]|uniref:2-phospho-L-lactate guanylyltransferase n=1 Tax=Natronorubrum sulfidifaciens JCM 14089 TaxID=1230460 RepID=L9W4F8_9EURY|nr:2-phospho-L-lactate guanylyltransferase [Natronorubrum sulfidifaciens]ELY44222.1 2-phospho-L-lactate guanylyltransferase CofC [Natronorubrum sulfidifaciens JCM 14089]
MHAVVPFAATDPKTRLASVLSPAERSTVARAMLADVLTAIVEAGAEPTVVSTAPLDLDTLSLEATIRDAVSVTVDDRPLTEAVNARLPASHDAAPTAVIMADLALATPDTLERCFSHDTDVTIAPGRSGGTNALVVSHPDFRVDYHGASYLDHCEIARDVGTSLETVDSFRLSTDIDEPDDLVEVLIHGTEADRAPACLRELGFALETRDGRVGVARLEETRRE